MSTIVENINPISVEVEPKYSVTTPTGAIVEIQEPDYIVHAQRKEYKVVGDNIYIPKLYDDAPQWMKDIIGTVVDVKTAVATGNLNDALKALRTLATELEVAKNTYTMSIVSSNDIDERITTAIETLNSSLTAADATILNIAQTAVTPKEASAIVINTLSASLSASGEIGSFIANMNAAFADLDSTTAQSINLMESAIEAEFSANATAINTIRTYVGVDEDGNSTGTGLFADVDLLKKQTDGIIETKTGTYDVILNASNPNTAQLIVTAEPYATWRDADATGIATRLAHIGDVYIKYSTTANGAKEYIASYKFIRTAVDTTSPYSTDADGFTWALVIDQAAQDAYTQALNAYTLADGKSSVYYGTLALRDSTSSGWTTAQKSSNIGDIWVISDTGNDQNKQFRWNGSTWVDIRDKKIVANAEAITQLGVDISNEAGLRASGDTSVTNTVKAYADTVGVGVETKWAYNSTVNLGGVSYNSGFGLATSLTSGSGLSTGQSEFWIKADKFKLMSADGSKKSSYSPFSVDANTGAITFNGNVTFSNVTGAPGGGSNLLYNSAPSIGFETKGWQADYNTTGIASSGLIAAGDPHRPTGGGSFFQYIPGTPPFGKVFDIRAIGAIPVIGGQFYEGSAYLNSHRCDSQIYVGWVDSAGAIIMWSMGDIVIQTNTTNVLSAWGRSKFIVQSPANAAACYYYIRGISTGEKNPYVFASMCYFGRASEGQSVFSNWSEGISAGATYTSELSNDAGFTTLGAVASQGYVLPAGVANAINTNTTTINGSKITTGSIAAAQIQANSVSADRLLAGTNASTVWTGGGLVSQNFNGNAYGNIGNPTSGFRLSSGASGTSEDPNIYGAYIKGSTIEGITLTISDVKVKSSVYPNNFGPIYLQSFASSTAFTTLTSITFMPANSGSGFLDTRMCTNNNQKFMIRAGLSNSTNFASISITLQASINGGAWGNIGIVTTGPSSILNSYLYTHTTSNTDSIAFRAICSKVSGDTATVFCYLDVYSVNGQ